MPTSNRKRVLFGLMLAISALAVSVMPAAAETVLQGCSGTCGYWEVKDTGPTGPKGAVCKYETGSYDLDFISVRPPLMHGDRPTKDTVQWRYMIMRSPNSGSSSFSNIYTSSWQSAQADDAIPAYAGKGFARRYWYAPESPVGYYKVLIDMRWKHNGSVEGNAAIEYDWYQRLWNGNKNASMEGCIQDW